MTSALFQAAGVHAGYGRDVPVVSGVTFEIYEGEVLAVIGPNGAGKSTLLKAVMGLVPEFTATIRFIDETISKVVPSHLVKAGLGYVPQGHQVFPEMTVQENLEMGCYWMKPTAAKRAVSGALDTLPQLIPLLRRQAGVLSGGEQQLVSIGRALTNHPKVLLIDEPSAGLSPKNTALIFEVLADLRKSGLGMMLVEQNARRALEFADRAMVLDMGKVRFEGKAKSLLSDPNVRKLYLGGAA